jgi:hypothetical protein
VVSIDRVCQRIYRVPGFLSSRPNRVPHPHNRKRLFHPPPFGSGGGGTQSDTIMLILTFYALLAGGRGLGIDTNFLFCGNRERRGYTQFF